MSLCHKFDENMKVIDYRSNFGLFLLTILLVHTLYVLKLSFQCTTWCCRLDAGFELNVVQLREFMLLPY